MICYKYNDLKHSFNTLPFQYKEIQSHNRWIVERGNPFGIQRTFAHKNTFTFIIQSRRNVCCTIYMPIVCVPVSIGMHGTTQVGKCGENFI